MNTSSFGIHEEEILYKVNVLFEQFENNKLEFSKVCATSQQIGPRIILTDCSINSVDDMKTGTQYAQLELSEGDHETNNNGQNTKCSSNAFSDSTSDRKESNEKILTNNNGNSTNFLKIPEIIINKNGVLKPTIRDCFRSEARPP